MIGIYCIRNVLNGKRYIGQSIDIERRFDQHKKALKCGYDCPVLQTSYNKYGEDSFVYEVLEECTLDKLNELETSYIIKYRTYIKFDDCKGYNCTLGGYSTDRDYLSKVHKGTKLSDYHIERIRQSMKGRVFSDEHKRNLSIAAKNRTPLTPLQRQKISDSLKGHKMSEDTKTKLSNYRKGYRCVNNGSVNKYTYSDEEFNKYILDGWVPGKLRRS